ncbi:oligosaccharide flippase family protein [Geodermatophilus sp. SYSU D00698]
MATTTGEPPTFRRALVLMTATSFLVPAAGVLTAPILARALDTAGRGELAAAQAPAALMLAVATLGLPDALTYHLAKRPGRTRAGLLWGSLITSVLGILCVLVTWGALPFLSAGARELGRLILLAAALTIPALVVGVFRGAATGRQMWGAVAAERLLTTVARVGGLVVLWLLGDLTVLTALLVGALTPVIAGAAYWRLLLPGPTDAAGRVSSTHFVRELTSFGSKVWVGSIASMLLARIGQIFMVPLSSVEDLGLYTVASTISDVPLIVALAIQNALFGVNSKTTDAGQLTATTRATLLVGFGGCAALGATLPFWLGPLFGEAFTAATVPTLMLLLSAVLCIPGLLAASGVAAWGRPGLRSLGLGITLVVNTIAFVVLVPLFGVYGACWTSILNNVVLTTFMVVAASRVMGVPVGDFVAVRGADLRRVQAEALRLVHRFVPRRLRRWRSTGTSIPSSNEVPVNAEERG